MRRTEVDEQGRWSHHRLQHIISSSRRFDAALIEALLLNVALPVVHGHDDPDASRIITHRVQPADANRERLHWRSAFHAIELTIGHCP